MGREEDKMEDDEREEKPAEARGRSGASKKLWIAVGIIAAASSAAIASGCMLLFMGRTATETEHKTYAYHIAIISDETDTSFWADVYRGAVEAGAEYSAYVEQIGDGLEDKFSMEDSIDIAIYEHVDGILLMPSDEAKTKTMIDKACSHDIPVITMQKDVPDSARQGFVGINDYFLGQEYGKRVLKIADEDTRLVTVLFPGASFNETSRNWFRSGLQNTVRQEKIRFDFRIIQDDKGLNNAEAVIHEIAEGNVQQPDVIICLDEVLTQSTYQLLRERRALERIDVIGSYISEVILKGLEEGYIDSTITIDPEAMGRMGVDALMTYKKYHMVSYYTEVGTMLVDRASAAAYRREVRDEGSGTEK